ncbi:redoxin [Limnohabitans sp. TS-CS-82]|nr:TlpA disulfide reductase family protein [Limnohabitans sp. TS-CS-82]PQA81655.1 redoxin [Limnohabitans sp. TS-CS-82]
MTISATRRHWLYAGVAAVAGLAGAGVAWRRHALTDMPSEALSTLWASEFESPTGEVLRLADFQGKPLVLNFWATWCAPCVEEMPLIDAFYRQNSAKGWQVLGLAIDQPSRVRQFLAQHAVSYPVGLAGLNGTELGKVLGNSQGGLPFTVVLNAHGQLKQRKLGKLSEDEVNNWVL